MLSLHVTDSAPRAFASRPLVSEQLNGAASSRNQLLAALSPDDLARLRPHLESLDLTLNEVLFDHEEPIRHVYFPDTSVVSLISMLGDGSTLEVGAVGREGIVSVPDFLMKAATPLRLVVQVPGRADRMSVDAFDALVETSPALGRLLLRHTQYLAVQIAQLATCNALHPVRERCVRSLLMTDDRLPHGAFRITHESLAAMLGVRRAGVTVAMRSLQDSGYIRYRRALVEIVDRDGLEQAACPCYRTMRGLAECLP